MSSDAQGIPHVEIDGEELTHSTTLEHIHYGPLEVETFSYDALGTKRVSLVSVISENPKMTLEYTEEQLQEKWGDVISDDPIALREGENE